MCRGFESRQLPHMRNCSSEGRATIIEKPSCATNVASFPGVAQLAERVAWDHEAVRAGLTTRTRVEFVGSAATLTLNLQLLSQMTYWAVMIKWSLFRWITRVAYVPQRLQLIKKLY